MARRAPASSPAAAAAGHELTGRRRPRGDDADRTDRADPPRPEDLIPTQLARRTRIVDHAYALLEVHDYDDIQMRDVADCSGVALGTVYRYFVSKEHLFAAVLVTWGTGLQERMDTSPLRGDSVPEQLADVYGRVIDAFARFPQFFRLMVLMETTTDGHARELFATFNDRARRSLAQPFGAVDVDGADDIADILMSVLNGVLRTWSAGQTTIDDAHRRMRRTIELIFSPAPSLTRRPAATP